ncbi:unnamed protein product [Clavelina lepadiformis]|uniref:Uncharacterized protein n=1 Tax=Clavelina lepadiformis TaxID=159417 RepID=A0ABP0FVC0_CLALP
MRFPCCKRNGDLTKCIPIYIIGAILLLAGIPLMIAGIVGGFNYSDFVGYIGGISIFFGVLFWFVWYMITIPNIEKMRTNPDDTKDATKDALDAAKKGHYTGFANLAFDKETKTLPGNKHAVSAVSISNEGSLKSLYSGESSGVASSSNERACSSKEIKLLSDEISCDQEKNVRHPGIITVSNDLGRNVKNPV